MRHSKKAKTARKISRDSRLWNRRLDKCEARSNRRSRDPRKNPNHPES